MTLRVRKLQSYYYFCLGILIPLLLSSVSISISETGQNFCSSKFKHIVNIPSSFSWSFQINHFDDHLQIFNLLQIKLFFPLLYQFYFQPRLLRPF
ncbi:unnamed protein product [Blepharisma stoltei]|uniref:Uncharacterized protein n=1 Tax=Blepharisma stoltei TaxID=1481888 RepID=A0AAU9KEJ6_9CILI|nr:unnamed protein product [Blepharisma stoltei]